MSVHTALRSVCGAWRVLTLDVFSCLPRKKFSLMPDTSNLKLLGRLRFERIAVRDQPRQIVHKTPSPK
jgi:hypothetical protein